MEVQQNITGWRVWGATVRGASHERGNKPNQDALGWTQGESDDFGGYVLAVADGHGSPRSSKSDVGASLAVEVLLELGKDYIKAVETPASSFSFIKEAVEQKLPRDLIRQWRERVDKIERQEEQKRREEIGNLPEFLIEDSEASPAPTDYLLYGSTVLGVLVTPHYVVYLQLGDGDILIVSDNGEVHRPFARDARLLANQTTSLATTSPTLNNLTGSASYASDVYVKFELFQKERPALILVSTDGYSNSYRDDLAFEQIGPDYLELLKTEGLPFIESSLTGWLEETSQNGSGDDITLGLIVRADLLPVETKNLSEATTEEEATE